MRSVFLWVGPIIALIVGCAAWAGGGGFGGTTPRARGRMAIADGQIRLLVRGPDGTPAANTSLEINADRTPGSAPPPQAQVTTDAQGVALFPWPGGETQLRVIAHGTFEAYGATGIVIVPSGGIVAPPLPPLVPLAHVEGTVPEAARRGTLTIRAGRSNSWGQWGGDVTMPLDASGHFAFNLISGEWYLSVQTDKERTAETPTAFYLTPGMRLNNVALRVVPTPPAAPAPAPTPETSPAKNIIIAHGTVRNAQGQPLPGAAIYVAADEEFGFRSDWAGYFIHKTTTDERGQFQITAGRNEYAVRIFVLAEGKPPTSVFPAITTRQMLDTPGAPRPATDVALSDAAGSLDVQVLGTDGKPVPDSTVILQAQGSGIQLENLQRPPRNDALLQALAPVAKTDAAGIAHFTNLAPNRYELAAAAAEAAARSLFTSFPQAGAVGGHMQGIAVRQAQRTLAAVQMQQAFAPPVVQPQLPNGLQDPAESQAYQYQRVGDSEVFNGSLQLNTQSQLIRVNQAGLWRLALQYRPEPPRFQTRPPYIGATGYAAVSQLLPPQMPLALQGTPRNPIAAQIQLRDVDGNPVRGIVELLSEGTLLTLSGSTDSAGNVRFDALPVQERSGPWNRYATQITILGKPTLDIRQLASPADIPSDEQLRGRKEYVPAWIDAESDQDAVVRARPEPAAYIRGKILDLPKPDPLSSQQTYIYLGHGRADTPAGATVKFFPETGDFIAGPLNGSEIELSVTRRITEYSASIHQRIPLRAGQVTHVDLHAPPLPAPTEPPGSPFLDSQQRLRVRVYMSDGKTFADGATVVCFYPEALHPSVFAKADARGQLSVLNQGITSASGDPDHEPSDSPPGFLAVASLPGTSGSIIVPVTGPLASLTEPLKIVLPPAMRLRGTLHVEGLAFPLKATAHVLAAYTGKGKLNELLSLETTVNADGTFELSGLTPGHYQVQAALDDLWFSQTAELEVTDHDPPALELNIAAPGAPLLVKVGAPNISVQASRPAGPLAAKFAPAYISDASGTLLIPTLESGPHTLTDPATRATVNATVPPATPENTFRPAKVTLSSRK